jgi:hypothetical protein
MMALSGKEFLQKEALKELYDAAESIWLGWEAANIRVRDWERLKEAVLKFREARERK